MKYCKIATRGIPRASALVGLMAFFLFQAPVQAQTVSFVSIDAPGNSGYTNALGIDGNNVVGNYQDSTLKSFGYFYNGNTGLFTTINPPGGFAGGSLAISGNNVIGSTFVYHVDTHPSLIFKFPVRPTEDATAIDGSNIVGIMLPALIRTLLLHGFLYNGATYATIDPPGSTNTYPTAISGVTIAGNFNSSGFSIRGFVYDGSAYTPIQVSNGETYITGISGNNVVGVYVDSFSIRHAFLYDRNAGTYTTLSLPFNIGSYAEGVSGNNIVGFYLDANYVYHSFLYNSGNYTPLIPPNSTSATAYGISGNYVVGNYQGSDGKTHGFLATITPTSTNTATVILSNLAATYDGTPKVVMATTTPPGLSVAITYNGSPTAPTAVGNYTVLATVIDPNYQGSATGTLVISAPQAGTVNTVFHRAALVSNGTSTAGIDDPLIPTSDISSLATQPTITKGLIADGVTPLILEFDPSGGSAATTNYTISVDEIDDGSLSAAQLTSYIRVLSKGSWTKSSIVSVPLNQPGFAYIQGFTPDMFTFNSGKTQLTVHMSLQANGTGPKNLDTCFCHSQATDSACPRLQC